MRQMTMLRAGLAGLALISLAGIAPALAQSNPDPQPGVQPIGTELLLYSDSLDPMPRYAVIPRVRILTVKDVPGEVKPVNPNLPEMRGGEVEGGGAVEPSSLSVGAILPGRRAFGGASAIAALPERHVNVKVVRDELADVRADLGL